MPKRGRGKLSGKALRRVQTQTLSQSRQEIADWKLRRVQGQRPGEESVIGAARGKADPSQPQVTLRLTHGTPKAALEHRLRANLAAVRRAVAQDKEDARQAKKRTYNKGALRSQRGYYDDDSLQTDTYSRLVLDSGAFAFGEGKFEPGSGLEKGKFVRDPGVGGVAHEPEDLGPVAIGGNYVKNGKGRPVGRPPGLVIGRDWQDR